MTSKVFDDCGNCFAEYDLKECYPLCLSKSIDGCGHFMCRTCVLEQVEKSDRPGSLQCPKCHHYTVLPDGKVENIPKFAKALAGAQCRASRAQEQDREASAPATVHSQAPEREATGTVAAVKLAPEVPQSPVGPTSTSGNGGSAARPGVEPGTLIAGNDATAPTVLPRLMPSADTPSGHLRSMTEIMLADSKPLLPSSSDNPSMPVDPPWMLPPDLAPGTHRYVHPFCLFVVVGICVYVCACVCECMYV